MIFKSNGFNLIELLITLSIISILMAMSYPLYQHHFIEERRLEAAHALMQLSLAMEKYQFENNTYVGATLNQLKMEEYIAKNNYRLMILKATSEDYLLAALPLGTQALEDNDCGTLQLNSRGEKSVTGINKAEACW